MVSSIDELYPANEGQRLRALRRYDILDTPPEKTFDRITAMAARLFNVPISVISLVDESRIWFKSHYGLNVHEIARDPGLCASAILQDEPWVLSDAKTDWRSKFNPLVTSDFGLQFYVGVPLKTPDGFNIGMLCVLDQKPHAVSKAQLADLKDLAAIVMEQMELRVSTKRAMASARAAGEGDATLELAGLIAKEYSDTVENSLELITGLLRHQSRVIEGSGDAAQLAFTANRVAAIQLAHQQISAAAAEGSTQVGVTGFLSSLCEDLKQAAGASGVQAIQVEGVTLEMASRPLIAIGLIVNELVMNAVGRKARQVRVSLARGPGGYAIVVTDDGGRLPPHFDPAASEDLGMKILLGQAQHLDAKVAAQPAEGFRGALFTVSFPPPPAD